VTSLAKPTKKKVTKSKSKTARKKPRKKSPLKTALFLCHCGSNIKTIIDIDLLKTHYEKQPNIVVNDDAHFCIEQGLNLIRDTIREIHRDCMVS
jgi:hypothetical protein